jgi:hypothetical protein
MVGEMGTCFETSLHQCCSVKLEFEGVGEKKTNFDQNRLVETCGVVFSLHCFDPQQ